MCGIGGWLGALVDGEHYAERMVRALRHRGPDGQDIRSWREATLVHTRLSIIDLTPTGQQPMANEDGTVWTVFNGEIYNHRDLRRGLQKNGHVFRGNSDSEVLPHLYEEHGSEFVSKLRGMFAVAIYDTRTRTLLLARDHFGIKPVFYAPGRDRLAFASEIRALLELPDIDARPDRQAVYDFAALFYIPGPETFYKGIRSLQPGEILKARLDSDGVKWETTTYHQWSITPDFGLTLEDATDRAEALLTTAVRQQLESDVPLGSLLSGGIDSSLVSVMAQDAICGGLRTFNVRFPEKDYDETWAAVAVARHIGSRHETLDMNSVRGSWEYIAGLLVHAGQPFADTSLFAVNAVCQLMRRNVTVALSGDGGDEGFAGYDIYWRIARIAQLQRFPTKIWHTAALAAIPMTRIGIVPDSLPQRIRDVTEADNTAVIQVLLSWIRQDEHEKLCQPADVLPLRRLFEPQWEHGLPRSASRLERLSAHTTEVSTRLTLPNDFLFKVDTASMRESLEVRVPMLDEELFAFGLSLPHELKVTGHTCKRVLRKLARQKLPPEVANKPKLGFGIPVDAWVDASFKRRLKEELLDRSTMLSEFFRPEIYRPLVKAFCDGRAVPGISREGLYQRVTMLLSVYLAADRNKTENNARSVGAGIRGNRECNFDLL